MKNISKIVKKNLNESAWLTPEEFENRLTTYITNTKDSNEWLLRSIMGEVADGLDECNNMIKFILDDPENATMVLRFATKIQKYIEVSQKFLNKNSASK